MLFTRQTTPPGARTSLAAARDTISRRRNRPGEETLPMSSAYLRKRHRQGLTVRGVLRVTVRGVLTWEEEMLPMSSAYFRKRHRQGLT
eukprot:3673267-Pyramimonas_sp.AAC.2